MLALCELRTRSVRTRAFGLRPSVGEKLPLIFDICGITFFTTHIHHCWQYHIRNQRTRLPLYNRWSHVSRTIPINIPNDRTLATDKQTDNNCNLVIQAAAWFALCGLRTRSVRLRRPSGVLPALLIAPSSSYNVYGTIDNKNVRRNRIEQNFGKDNGSMVCRTKLLNQLGVTEPIESLHNLIETLKSDRPRHFVTFLRN